MLVLFESPAGFSLLRVDDDKLEDVSKLAALLETPEEARNTVTLLAFARFGGPAEALAATVALVEGKLDKGLQAFLKANVVDKGLHLTGEKLAVVGTEVGGIIEEKLGVQCVGGGDSRVVELMRGIRSQQRALVGGAREVAVGRQCGTAGVKMSVAAPAAGALSTQRCAVAGCWVGCRVLACGKQRWCAGGVCSN